jgi:hypothetical protein
MLELVAFDIETTGFDVGDEVTVIGFAVPMGVRVFAQTGGRDVGDVADAVGAATDTAVQVSTHRCEREVLTAVAGFAADRFRDEDVLLAAYNGERFRGGFDLPFLRTRYANHDVAWPFTDVAYADVLPLVSNRFNTTVDGDECSDLEAAYDLLCDGAHGALDPFADSAEAVAAFTEARVTDLVLHNVADVLRTRALARVAQRYCSKSDFGVKSLTPVVSD